MKIFVRFCARENIAILADEVYQENIYRPGDKFISFKKVMCDLKLDCQLVSFHSTSKGYWGECGRRGGYLEMVNFPEDVRAELYKLLSICCCSNVDGQYTMDVMINPPKPGDASSVVNEAPDVSEADDIFIDEAIDALLESLNDEE